jgi:hypothetical protein
VRAILDEQLSPRIAALVRKVGYDVDADADPEDLVARSDRTILEVACLEGAPSSRTTSRTPSASG